MTKNYNMELFDLDARANELESAVASLRRNNYNFTVSESGTTIEKTIGKIYVKSNMLTASMSVELKTAAEKVQIALYAGATCVAIANKTASEYLKTYTIGADYPSSAKAIDGQDLVVKISATSVVELTDMEISLFGAEIVAASDASEPSSVKIVTDYRSGVFMALKIEGGAITYGAPTLSAVENFPEDYFVYSVNAVSADVVVVGNSNSLMGKVVYLTEDGKVYEKYVTPSGETDASLLFSVTGGVGLSVGYAEYDGLSVVVNAETSVKYFTENKNYAEKEITILPKVFEVLAIKGQTARFAFVAKTENASYLFGANAVFDLSKSNINFKLSLLNGENSVL